jgi:hypothetical protein
LAVWRSGEGISRLAASRVDDIHGALVATGILHGGARYVVDYPPLVDNRRTDILRETETEMNGKYSLLEAAIMIVLVGIIGFLILALFVTTVWIP